MMWIATHGWTGRALSEVLAGLIHAYEAEVDPLPELDPVAALRFLLEENGITQSQLAEQTGLAMATISEILNGKRGISPKARQALAKRFRVDPSLFARSLWGT